MALTSEYNESMNVVQAEPKDERIGLMGEMVKLEGDLRRAENEANKTAAYASDVSDKLAQVRARLHEALGVSDMQRGEDFAMRTARETY